MFHRGKEVVATFCLSESSGKKNLKIKKVVESREAVDCYKLGVIASWAESNGYKLKAKTNSGVSGIMISMWREGLGTTKVLLDIWWMGFQADRAIKLGNT